MALSKLKTNSITDSSVTSANITDGTIVNADVNASADIAASKVAGCGATSASVTLAEHNIGLLGFKMAVNDSLTVYNLVDGVVDEFHDESGTDEGEGSNDTYTAACDVYVNQTATPYSAGFGYNARTEADTSNPGCNTYSQGIYTVPTGVTSLDVQAWGAGGGITTGVGCLAPGGGGGYSEGTFAVTASQVLAVSIGQGGYGSNEPNETLSREGGKGYRGAGDGGNQACGPSSCRSAGGGGASGMSTAGPGLPSDEGYTSVTAPEIVLIAGGGGGGGYSPQGNGYYAGGGGGLTGNAGAGSDAEQTNLNGASGGGGDQEQGGTGGASVNPPPDGNPGQFLEGGTATTNNDAGGGGEGFYGGGGAGVHGPSGDHRTGGGGSSYYGHPQVTSGATEDATGQGTNGGSTQPGYVGEGVNGSGEGGHPNCNPLEKGGAGNGYVLVTASAQTTATTNIVSNAFTASSAPSTARIVVFQENIDSITLNTDIKAYISRDGGSNFTQATLADSGYVVGSSGQRILTGTATVSGQPSGTNMRWKLTLANNQSKVHGIHLGWA